MDIIKITYKTDLRTHYMQIDPNERFNPFKLPIFTLIGETHYAF